MNKKRKNFVSFVCILLAVLMALSLIMMVIPARAVSETEIEALRAKRVQLEQQLQAQAAEIQALADSQALIIDRKAALDRQIELNREDIGLLEEEIRLYDALIWEKELELESATLAEAQQVELLRGRMRAMEESGELTYLSFLFDASSLADLLSRLGDVSDIMHYDRDLEASLQESRASVEALKREYEQIRLEQDGVHAELATRQSQLDAQVAAACSLIAHLDEMGEEAAAEYAAIAAAEARAMEEEQAALRQLAAEQEAARQAALALAYSAGSGGGSPANTGSGAASSGGTYESTYGAAASAGVGNFIWPVDSTYITSNFGSRTAPTAGATSNHPAIDIGALAGSPIYAVADGQVAVATYNNGLGNYVSIAHDGDTSTRYSHMTNFIVQPGEYVTQGQIIGYVGQTGIATGDHLDFAVMENGQAVDPLQYYDSSALTFDPTA